MTQQKKPKPNEGYYYSSLGIQMVMMIGICVFIGVKLDKKVQNETPWFTLGLALFGIAAALIYVMRKVL